MKGFLNPFGSRAKGSEVSASLETCDYICRWSTVESRVSLRESQAT